MSTNILMPALSPTMTEGKLLRWLKKEGEAVSAGDVVAEIETDKATMEVEAVDEGVLGRILVDEGAEAIKVNTPIAILVAEGEAVPDAPGAPAPAAAAPAPTPAPTASAAPVTGTSGSAAPATPAAAGPAKGKRIFASPLARRIAGQKGIDLSTLKGSGPNGRIVRRDVEQAAAQPAAPPQPAAPAQPPAMQGVAIAADTPHHTVANSTMRKVIARRLTEAKSTIPHFYVEMDVELDALLALRSQLNAASPADGAGAYKISVNDMLIKAAAITLRRVPDVNVSHAGDVTVHYDNIDISMAVSIPDGLITPIVRQADLKSLGQISTETRGLIRRAREGKLKPHEFQGGTFSISNMGMMGVKAFSAIINPPQAAILAIAAGEARPVVKDGEIRVATVMTVTLSVDHRVVDGALAAQWVSVFRSVVENPLSLVV